MKFLQEDSAITSLLSRLMDLVLVNVFWFVCCIPLVTIGAATTAMYDVCMKLAFREEIGIISTFFRSFVRHLKRGSLLFFLSAAAGGVLVVDFWSATHWNLSFKFVFQVVILSVGYFYLAVISHAFPALAYFEEPVFQTIRHAFVLAMRNGIYTVFVMLMGVLPVLLFFLMPEMFWKSLFLWLTVGIAFLAYLNSLHLARLFDPERFREVEEKRETEERQQRH
jgi:uncharacterized membrane protein YesL